MDTHMQYTGEEKKLVNQMMTEALADFSLMSAGAIAETVIAHIRGNSIKDVRLTDIEWSAFDEIVSCINGKRPFAQISCKESLLQKMEQITFSEKL